MLKITPNQLLDYQYAIVDQIQFNVNFFESYPIVELFPDKNKKHLFPILLPLEKLSKIQKEELVEILFSELEQNNKPIVSMFINADNLKLVAFKNYLEKKLVISTNGHYSLFRFYDPRVFTQLLWMWSSEQLSNFYSSINSCCFCLNKQFYAYINHDIKHNYNRKQSKVNLNTLHRIGLINRTLDILNLKVDLQEHTIKSQQINTLIEKAQSNYQIYSECDLILFAKHGMLISLNFDLHSILQNRFNDKKFFSKTNHYTQMCRLISSTEWLSILNDFDIEDEIIIRKVIYG